MPTPRVKALLTMKGAAMDEPVVVSRAIERDAQDTEVIAMLVEHLTKRLGIRPARQENSTDPQGETDWPFLECIADYRAHAQGERDEETVLLGLVRTLKECDQSPRNRPEGDREGPVQKAVPATAGDGIIPRLR